MKPAPFQLDQLSFRRVHVEMNPAMFEDGDADPLDSNLGFDGVSLRTNVSCAAVEDASVKHTYFLTLRVLIDNKARTDGTSVKSTPYLVDVEAGAVVRIAREAEAQPDIEDIVRVNGTSILWSSIREQICTLTARMPLGQATLPTVHFQDLRKQSAAAPAGKHAKPSASRRGAKSAARKQASPAG